MISDATRVHNMQTEFTGARCTGVVHDWSLSEICILFSDMRHAGCSSKRQPVTHVISSYPSLASHKAISELPPTSGMFITPVFSRSNTTRKFTRRRADSDYQYMSCRRVTILNVSYSVSAQSAWKIPRQSSINDFGFDLTRIQRLPLVARPETEISTLQSTTETDAQRWARDLGTAIKFF